MSKKIFISHKNSVGSNEVASHLNKFFIEKGYDSFFDKKNLEGGDIWKQDLLNNVIDSDVFVVVIDRETIQSDWVQREIDVALAHEIQIIALIIDNKADIEATLKRFSIEDRQYMTYIPQDEIGHRELLDKLIARIEILSAKTYNLQQRHWKKWEERHIVHKTPGRSRPEATTFTHNNIKGVKFCIALGDASKIKTYDILVNSENNYMQMARFFETNTLSYAIRRGGHILKVAKCCSQIRYKIN